MVALFRITTHMERDRCVLALTGEVDLDVADDLIQLGHLGLDEAEVTILVLDLAGVTFMDSTALGAMIGLHNTAERCGKRVALANVPDRVHRLLSITALETFFDEADPGASEAI